MKNLKYNGTITDDHGGVHHCVGTEEEPESILGEFGFNGEEKEAKLIAAAPDLLEALEYCLESL